MEKAFEELKLNYLPKSNEKIREYYLTLKKESREKMFNKNRNLMLNLISNTNLISNKDLIKKESLNKQGDISEVFEKTMKIKEKETLIKKKKKLKGSPYFYYSKLFQIPEWLNEIPNDLNSNWFVFTKPEGQRCFLFHKFGTTVAIDINGFLIDTVDIQNFGNNLKKKEIGLIDCIYQKSIQTFFIIDILYWKFIDYTFSNSELRNFIIESNFSEKLILNNSKTKQTYFIVSIKKFYLNTESFKLIYLNEGNFLKDGIMFLNKVKKIFEFLYFFFLKIKILLRMVGMLMV